MKPYALQFVHTHETTKWVILEDVWSLRPDFRWRWMSKFAGWLIRKIGVNARDQVVEVQRLVIDPPAIMQKLFEQHSAMLDMGYEPKRLLIGSEDFAELMRQPEMHHHFTIDAEYYKGGRDGRRVLGLTIEVIPWMRGILVMPN